MQAMHAHGLQRSDLCYTPDPKNLRVLVIDSKGASRQTVSALLRDCQYQVTAVKTTREALQLLPDAPGEPDACYDLILKEHEPPTADACRLLRKMEKIDALRRIPVVVMSTQDEREIVMNCLAMGAIDYLVKPLRQNELRHIWTRIWWWKRAQGSDLAPIRTAYARGHTPFRKANSGSFQASSSDSQGTTCEDEDEPTSKEGSAPDAIGNGHGSNGNGSNDGNGSNGSKEGNGTSRVEAKPHCDNNGNGNGSSDNKNGNGNSATKNGHNGSNGNGASTTLAADRNGNALVNTAEGKMPAHLESLPLVKSGSGSECAMSATPPPSAPGRSSAFAQYTAPSTSLRKRPITSETVPSQEEDETPIEQGRSKLSHRDRAQQLRGGSMAGSNPNASGHTLSEDTFHHRQGSGSYKQTGSGSGERQGSQGVSPSHYAGMQSNLSRGMATAWGPGHHMGPLQGAPGLQQLAGLFPAQYPGLPPQLLPQQLHPLAMYHAATPTSTSHSNPMQMDVLPAFFPLTSEQLVVGDPSAVASHSSHSSQRPLHHPALPHVPGMPALDGSMPASGATSISAAFLHQLLSLQHLHPQPVHLAAHPGVHSALTHPLPHPAGVHAHASHPSHSHPSGSAPHTARPASQPPHGHCHGPMAPAAWRPQAPHFPPVGAYPGAPQPASNLTTHPANQHEHSSLASGGTGTTAGANGVVGVRKAHLSGMPEPKRRRALALDKYRKKRNNLKFSKTIRYESRKQLAQQRPRIKGQFVKHGPGEDGDKLGEVGADGEELASGRRKGYWQEEGYDPEDGSDDEDMDEDEEGAADEDPDTGNDHALLRGIAEQVGEDEAGVVNSLMDLREGAARKPDASSGGHPKPKNSGATAQTSLGSQSGREDHHSRGTHGHSHRHNSHSRSISHQKQQPSPADVREARDNGGGRQHSAHHDPGRSEGAGNNGGGKNGSDSGSNSPDENGGSGTGRGENGHGHSHRKV